MQADILVRSRVRISATLFTIFSVLVFGSPPNVSAQPTIAERLREADRLAWLTDWYSALPIYEDVERLSLRSGDTRSAMYARFGRLRGRMQQLSLPDISEEIARALETPLGQQDATLRLRGLTIKGDIDLEWDLESAQRAWQEARQVAEQVGNKGWENRATGELGMIAFLKGNTGGAGTLVQKALQGAAQDGDVGGQLRYMTAIGHGLFLAGYGQLATGYVDKALKFAAEHPETGFPFVAYSTKVLTLLAANQPEEAERLAKTAMAEARAGDRRIKETELSLMLAQIATNRGQSKQAIDHLERAAATARAGNVQRLLADAESVLADAYRAGGDLANARRHSTAAVAATRAAGSRFMLPERLRVLAEIYAAQGSVTDADRVYEEAEDIVEGIMMTVPSREAQARLIGVTSDIYTGHFRLAAQHLSNPVRAYEIIERARGRAASDVLRALPAESSSDDRIAAAHSRTISQLQVRLMRARGASERQALLDQLWETEQRTSLQGSAPRINLLVGRNRVRIKALQQSLADAEVILEYVLAEPRSYCLVISRGRIRLVSLASKQQIEDSADRFVAKTRGAGGGLAEAAKALHDLLIHPVGESQSAKRLFIVPDGKLHLLPFDTLFASSLGRSPIVSTVPSASVFHLIRTRAPAPHAQKALLAVGGVQYDRLFGGKGTTGTTRSDEPRGLFDAAYPSQLPNLPSAQGEVLAAAKLLGPSSVVLSGEQATESAVKSQRLIEFAIMHFAVHAFADPKFPGRAALVLAGDAANGDDGLLQPREIGRFRLDAGVVVLSACDTGVGPTLGQEGVLNIARAFLLAGARSVITTLWVVSDVTSATLMRRFYENVVAGHDVAEALTRSKASVVEQFGPDSLSTVAAFQIVGVGDYRATPLTNGKRALDHQRSR